MKWGILGASRNAQHGCTLCSHTLLISVLCFLLPSRESVPEEVLPGVGDADIGVVLTVHLVCEVVLIARGLAVRELHRCCEVWPNIHLDARMEYGNVANCSFGWKDEVREAVFPTLF